MGWFVPLIQAVGAIAGGALASKGAGDAADAQGDAAGQANALQKYMYDQTRADLSPYRDTGYNALNALNRAMGLPGVQPGGNAQEALFGGGDRPMTREELNQAYQLVLNRDADESGLNYYMTGGPKVGEQAGYGDLFQAGLDDATNLRGPLSSLGILRGDDDRERRPFTFNEFLNATLGSDEYRQKVSGGQIEAWDPSRLEPQQQEVAQTVPDDRYGGFEASPGYQWAHDQAMKGGERAASAGGYLPSADGGLSGRFSKEMSRYSQGLASQEFGNYINRLAGLAGTGQTATTNTGLFGQNYANSAGQSLIRAGDARASGIIGQNNAWGGAIAGAANAYGSWMQGDKT